MQIPFPGENNPVEIPGTTGIDAEQHQAAGISKEAGQQSNPHESMQLRALENISGDAEGKCARSERGKHHDVEGFPNAPAKSVIHTADRAQSGELAIGRKQKGQENENSQHLKWAGHHRHAVDGDSSFPTIGVGIDVALYCAAHSCALNPVFFSSSCNSSS